LQTLSVDLLVRCFLCMQFSVSLQTALWWGTGVSGNFSANFSYAKLVYRLPSQKIYLTRKTHSSIERTIVSKNWIKQLHTLPVLHFNPCLTTEYSETTAHFNDNLLTTKSTYRRLSAQRLSECSVYITNKIYE
jgi:hypothetical protein